MTKKSVDSEIPVENSTTDMDALTATETLPEVNENAMAAVQEQAQETAQAERQVAPAEPVTYNKDGSIRKKRAPYKKRGSSEMNVPKKDDLSGTPEITSRAAAETMSGIIELASVKVISEEWGMTEKERASNINAWEKTFDHYGGVNMPPPLALAANYMGIIVSRGMSGKETQSKFSLFKAWIATKIFRKKKDARIDSGKNAERKDNIRDEKSPFLATAGDTLYSP